MSIVERLTKVAKALLGTSNESLLRGYRPLVAAVGALEGEMIRLDDAELRARSHALRDAVRAGTKDLEAAKIEAFAMAREAADRRLGMWTAIADADAGFDDWGDCRNEIETIRAALKDGAAPWDLDLSAKVYAQIRQAYPKSSPPFRMRAHDVQVLGAGVLHDGRIAEMKTGEGKTLVASLACYLNALAGKGVHLITVNEYLAGRDARWNEPTFRFLGVSVAALRADMSPPEKKLAYQADITYGTNNEFGFDYLRDNLKQSLDDQVQTNHTFAIVDEVDSVLVDEARTPLIISGPAQSHTELFIKANEVAKQLVKDEHFEVDIKDRTISLSETGVDRICELLEIENLYDPEHMHLPHFIDNALKAHHLFHRDKEYLLQNNEVKIVDEFTGRVLAGRRWSDGLHQAVEAKEGARIQDETQTYATITLQNFFRLYGKLAGMTGTAMTEADEFHAIYGLEVIAIPTNKPIARRDLTDLIYGSEAEKFEAIANEVMELHAVGQPILVGTVAVETSERLSALLKRRGVPHEVLNARQNAREAEIVARAGQLGAVTIATNMAGRGTDIVLGKASLRQLLKHWVNNSFAPKRMKEDSPELDEAILDLWAKHYLGEEGAEKLRGSDPATILDAVNRKRQEQGWHPLVLPSSLGDGVDVRTLGGLRIIGTERHESRRIDNQLRGRSGRQGDPGSSRFYLSLDDDLMKRFAGPRMAGMMRSMGLRDGIPIENRWVSRSVEKAQKRVEEYHYGIRKNLLEYDQVMNLQRTKIYAQRQELLKGADQEEFLRAQFQQAIDDFVQEQAADGTRGAQLEARLREQFINLVGLDAPELIPVKDGGDACRNALLGVVQKALEERKVELGPTFPVLCRFLILDTIDRRWKDHLYAMDHLRAAIGLEGYGQKDPKMRYKQEGFKLFLQMQDIIRKDLVRLFFRVQVQTGSEGGAESMSSPGPAGHLQAGGFMPRDAAAVPSAAPAPLPMGAAVSTEPGPDDPCPCGSGRPYGQCHGVF
ncbi:MAG: preprotein translocase subunit SecA [Planctomycetota bacterium]|nr:MAG: preprotein translocase subunit SecA [Planctomycetota bacterium]